MYHIGSLGVSESEYHIESNKIGYLRVVFVARTGTELCKIASAMKEIEVRKNAMVHYYYYYHHHQHWSLTHLVFNLSFQFQLLLLLSSSMIVTFVCVCRETHI
jgi:hypothetical protein